METTDMLQAELEELQKRYWNCFNNWECDETLEKIFCKIDELKHRLAGKSTEMVEYLRQVV